MSLATIAQPTPNVARKDDVPVLLRQGEHVLGALVVGWVSVARHVERR